jgi:hypothetical protein
VVPDQARAVLAAHGWDVSAVYDMCWLDCSADGYFRQWADSDGRRWEICLCLDDALTLQRGAFKGNYAGAPLPVDSRRAEWPWLPAEKSVTRLGAGSHPGAFTLLQSSHRVSWEPGRPTCQTASCPWPGR